MDLNTFSPLIYKLANSMARKYPGVSSDDISQEMFMQVWEKSGFVDSLPAAEQPAYVNVIATKAGNKFSLKERNRLLVVDDRYYYQPTLVREMLPYFFASKENWDSLPIPDDAVDIDGGEYLALFADLSKAFAGMPESHRKSIVVGIVAESNRDDMAALLSQSVSTVDRVHRRAIAELTDRMNGTARARALDHDGPKLRKNSSKAANTSMIKDNY